MDDARQQIINYGNINNITDENGDLRGYMVYCHIAPNEKVYIGQTCQTLNQRAKDGIGYRTCTCFYNAIKKHGWDNFKHIELISGLSKEMADIVEIELIKKYKTQDIDYGYNISYGGTLPINKKTVYQYDMDGNYVTQYNTLSIAASHFNVSRLRPYAYLYEDIFHSCNYLWTFTDRGEKIDDDILDQVLWVISTHGSQKKCSKVYQYDMDYNLISVYKSNKDAMLQTGINQYGIKGACASQRAYDNYIWSYVELDDELINKYDSILKCEPKIVHQYSSDGELVGTFISQTEAAKSIGANRPSEISNCCLGKQFTSRGFVWSYSELSKEEVIDKFYQSKLVKSKRKAEEYLNQFK